MTYKNIDLMTLPKTIIDLRCGDAVLLSGSVYTARDAAHKKLFQLLDAGIELPLNLSDAVIYYTGPTPTKPGDIIGSCGPTTSSRLDVYTPRLHSLGLRATIGKGERSQTVADSIALTNSVYFCAPGGAGALAQSCVTSCDEIAFPELGCESIKKLTLLNLPVFVCIDSLGNSLLPLL